MMSLIDDLFDAVAEVPAAIIKLPTKIVEKILEEESDD